MDAGKCKVSDQMITRDRVQQRPLSFFGAPLNLQIAVFLLKRRRLNYYH